MLIITAINLPLRGVPPRAGALSGEARVEAAPQNREMIQIHVERYDREVVPASINRWAKQRACMRKEVRLGLTLKGIVAVLLPVS